ncbi:MAG: YwaF family protein [Clostridia bacterium]|nr:YwaF family protein [Clostridia bacterium]
MTTGSITHICFFVATATFLVLSSIAVSKLSEKWQNIVFIIAAVLGTCGIFFRYAMNLSFAEGLHPSALLVQMLQVCNFNFLLLPLMLIPGCEIARQYSVYFSMFAATTTFFSVPSALMTYEWYDISVLNFWFNHIFAVALPIWMMASGRLRPKRSYIPAVSGSVFTYFGLVYLITEALVNNGILPEGSNYSYVYDPKGLPLLTQLYKAIGQPFVYLLPVFLIMLVFFYLWSMPFDKSIDAARGALGVHITGDE